jgi:hypothetical protein
MHIGITGTRGRDRIEKLAAVAAREFDWNQDEAKQQVGGFLQDLDKDRVCLKA